MTIRQIPFITIDGRNSAFGGYIYNLDYQPSFSSAPSKLTVHFINESGTYFPPKLSTALSTPYTIRIGDDATITMYAIKSKKTSSPTGGKILVVEFVDGSFLLDKKWVGLYKHYASATGIYDSVLVIGQEFHPCDLNKDGKVDGADKLIYDNLPLNVCTSGNNLPSGGIAMNSGDYLHNPYLDPVPPSGLSPTGSGQYYAGPSGDMFSMKNFCGAIYSMKIFDMGYNFEQLLGAVEAAGIQIWKNPTGSYSGKSYYPASNSGYFLRESGPLRESLRRFCSDYGYDFFWDNGAIHFIDVKTPIALDYLQESGVKNASDWSEEESLEGTVRRGHASYYEKVGEWADTMCSSSFIQYLSPVTLNMMFGVDNITHKFGDLYGQGSDISLDLFLTSTCFAKYGANARAFFWLLCMGNGALGSPNGMWDSTQAEGLLNSPINEYGKFTITKVYAPVAGHGLPEYNKIMALDQSQEKYDFYIVANFDESLANEQFRLDEEFADFFGKYYFDTWGAVPCGGQPSYTTEADAKAELVKAPIDILFFSNGNPFWNKSYKFTLDKGVLATRSPKWSPSPKSSDVIAPLAQLAKMIPHKVVIGDKKAFESLNLKDNDIVYGCYDMAEPSLSISPIVNNDELGATPTASAGKLGLRAANHAFLVSMGVAGQFTLAFSTPCNIFDGGNLNVYKIAVRGENSAKFPVNKIQDAMMSETNAGIDTLTYAMNHIDIADADIRLLAWNSNVQCLPLSGILQSGHNALNKLMSFDIADPRKTISFNVAGIGISGDGERIYPSVASGLNSLQVSIDANGIKTAYSFANRPKSLPSVELMKHSLFTRTKLPDTILP